MFVVWWFWLGGGSLPLSLAGIPSPPVALSHLFRFGAREHLRPEAGVFAIYDALFALFRGERLPKVPGIGAPRNPCNVERNVEYGLYLGPRSGIGSGVVVARDS